MNDQSLAEAYAARQAGNPQRTVEICRAIIARTPMHHEARSLLALVFAEAGHIDKARPLIEQAVEVEPDNWRFLLNLSVLRELEEKPEAALAAARKATGSGAQRFEVWGRLGDLAGQQGNFDEAVEALQKALALQPAHPGLPLLLAAAAFEAGRYDVAEEALGGALLATSEQPEAMRLRAHLARRRGDNDRFVDLAHRWLKADPASEEARMALADGLAQRDDYHAAVEVYRSLVEGAPADADRAAIFAQYLMWARDFAGAERAYEQALATHPDHSAAAAGMARLQVYRGKFAEAGELARRAIDADPGNVDAYAQLALASGMKLPDADIESLEAIAHDPAVFTDHRAIAWFTLGDLRHKRREHAQAFAAWEQANGLKHEAAAHSPAWRYDPAGTEAQIGRLQRLFAKLPPRVEPGAGPTPLFIVGMPRSGTTLLDSAMAAHGEVTSGGELPAMPSLLARFFEWAGRADWRGGAIPPEVADDMRNAYLKQFARYAIPPARFVTDKQPANILAVGLMRQLFPQSPVIHIRRNALETGFSIFRNNMTKAWRFATSQTDIGHYYAQYVRLMEHWRDAAGEGMIEVDYEALVDDFEGQLRRLFAFAGLDWEPAALSYFEQENTVTTLSSAQVRQAPSRSMISSTGPYHAQLRPLQDALKAAGVKV